MDTLRIQRVLREGMSLTQLNDKYGIISKRSEKHPNLYLFKYDQIRSPMSESIVQECRGLILDKDASWQVVCFPYTKFFNYGETNCAKLDLDSIEVYQKLDGSLLNLYYYKDSWWVSTSGNPDASGPVLNELGNNTSFKKLFWEVWNKLGYNLPPAFFKTLTFMFELTTPFNKVVVQHKSSNIILHGIRNRISFEEINLKDVNNNSLQGNWSWCNWDRCQTISFKNIDKIISYANTLNPLEEEGFVLVDKHFNRAKIKSEAYVNLHHIRSTMSSRAMLEVIRKNECEEFLQYFSEYKELHRNIKTKYTKLIILIQSFVNEWKYKKLELEKEGKELTRKEVGLYFKDYFFCGIMFKLLFDEDNLESLLAEMSIRKLEFWLEEIK